MVIGSDFRVIVVVLGGLFVFGFLYDRLVAWLELHGYDEGFTAFLVMGGVLVTLAGYGVMVYAALYRGVCVYAHGALPATAVTLVALLLCFAASGFWMVVGSMQRYMLKRRNGQVYAMGVGVSDDESTAVAE